MAIYEYFCPTCRNKFEERRPMSQATAVATCDKGHKAERTITTFAFAGGSSSDPMAEMADMGGGGCCGGGACGCGQF
jgi:putative FmdB family regulatory protein